ncbi:MAG: 2-aminoethylphosphonate--pyruvate transaminase [Alphaproteobacteria bacterium]|nr:2-aminoethylphosphonate--pyruvate transaminase [Alphaproteobacteria bacterium]
MILLTPGPLTTARETREAMLSDWGSRDGAFIALTAQLRRRLLALVHGEQTHVCVPIQGSGTYVIEAAIGSLIGPDDKLLVLENGVYGARAGAIAERLGRQVSYMHWPQSAPVDPETVRAALRADPSVTHVLLVHCETTTGILNPLQAVADAVAAEGRALIVDAMSSFGAFDIDLRRTPSTAILASSNKCLEGPPGIAFAIVARQALEAAGTAASVSLDLKAQWQGFEKNGQWRFTPPVQVVSGTVKALELLEAEGGPPARLARYRDNFAVLLAGMKRLGFSLYLDETVQSPIIATFHMPKAWGLTFAAFYDALAACGFLIYPGKLTGEETFRIGCIGAIGPRDFESLLAAITSILDAKAPGAGPGNP